MRVHHLNCGTLRPLGGRLVDGQGGFLHQAEMVCHCLLIETGSGLVLVDTGLGEQGMRRPREWFGAQFSTLINPQADLEQTPAAQIRALGLDPAEVRHVVLTHLDLDHAGGLADFPEATVHVYAEELRAATAPATQLARTRYRDIQFRHEPRWASYAEPGENWFGFQAVRQLDGLPPEILLVPLAGHTAGHAGVAVDTGAGWLLHAGDAYFYHGQMDPIRPHCTPALSVFQVLMQTDGAKRRENLARLQELAATHTDEVTMFSAHSAVELRQSRRTAA
ncbi:MBL fold metallo-hydrolase [Amycolatopsis cihanbeyliensis]|uniref:Metallo-beta-lactamase superfamily protein n=1 Tax=Amycolatopsis cihanbeyliensis TaxID=1128664 RepID=A0A542DIE8_AMYCI|nr:MBL fold metallo-hydrolase [Amycolatopsis cihanbeyliensis]TQJ02853.1 metallo-beta-lactamase superfamily protein [Amycolatopsis cihanbeyliensis]